MVVKTYAILERLHALDEYLTVDPLKVHEALQSGLEDLRAFIVYVMDFLRREGYLQE